MSAEPVRSHYSYSVYADPATAQSFDRRRFGGPIGELIADAQAEVLMRFAGDVRGRSVLDVGTGTGRAALLLAGAGADVTGIDASSEMLAVAHERAADVGANVRFQAGDAHHLDFPNRSFDIVVSLRVLMHTPDWRVCVSELCRVADRRVIVDYPSRASAAAAQSVGRKLLHALGSRTEPYRVFGRSEIRDAFAAAGFRIAAIHRQFVLPIAFHKAVGSPRLTRLVEGALERAGLLRLFGSPVTILAERCATS